MSIVIMAPNNAEAPEHYTRIFLAGSIEMGGAEKWQDKVQNALEKSDCVILNPRRDDWDSSWEQKIENHEFCNQVQWELSALEDAHIILMYFDPATKSPISLLEFGLYARTKKLLVVCPEGFWRKGNVDIVCAAYGVRQLQSLDAAISFLKGHIG